MNIYKTSKKSNVPAIEGQNNVVNKKVIKLIKKKGGEKVVKLRDKNKEEVKVIRLRKKSEGEKPSSTITYDKEKKCITVKRIANGINPDNTIKRLKLRTKENTNNIKKDEAVKNQLFMTNKIPFLNKRVPSLEEQRRKMGAINTITSADIFSRDYNTILNIPKGFDIDGIANSLQREKDRAISIDNAFKVLHDTNPSLNSPLNDLFTGSFSLDNFKPRPTIKATTLKYGCNKPNVSNKKQYGGNLTQNGGNKKIVSPTEYFNPLLNTSDIPGFFPDFINEKGLIQRHALGLPYAPIADEGQRMDYLNRQHYRQAGNSNAVYPWDYTPFKRNNNVDLNDLQTVNRIQSKFVHLVENPTNKNYDSVNQRYYAYDAIEDGGKTKDIGDGLKLTKDANPELLQLYNKQTDENGMHYITKQQHDNAVLDRTEKDYIIAAETYNRHIKNSMGIDNAWNELNAKEKAFLIDYQYNVKNGGLKNFSRLMTAVRNKDVEAIKKESERFEVKREKNGKILSKKPLGRNKNMAERADDLYND